MDGPKLTVNQKNKNEIPKNPDESNEISKGIISMTRSSPGGKDCNDDDGDDDDDDDGYRILSLLSLEPKWLVCLFVVSA